MINKIKRRLLHISNEFKFFCVNRLWFSTPAGRRNLKELKKYKNKYAGKRCFIMGNGPSLLKCDLKLLKDEVTIASNAQFLIWDQMGFIPQFLTVEDRLVAEDRKDELNAIDKTTKIFPRDLSKFLKISENTFYIDFLRNYKDFPKFSDDFVAKVYWGGTVSFLNLQLAYYLGFKEIYMIGFDHSYKVTEKIESHVITSDHDDVNHIHPNYFGKGYRWHDPNVERMELAYVRAKSFFESKGVKVFNATVGGKLEVFERIDYVSLF
ncbi:MAG: DUF115 domain-containing protein [Flavobacterium sp.]|nr:MAG: DUF115 domain-containing protein [Flavobacterium sp.]